MATSVRRPQAPIGAHRRDQVPGRGEHVRIDPQSFGPASRRGNEHGRAPARRGDENKGDGDDPGVRNLDRSLGSGGGSDQDREEGRALDQRVAGRELGRLQVIGKDAVFHRPEQRREHAEHAERSHQDGDRVQPESDRRHHGRAEFRQLHRARHQRFVESIGHLAADAGKKKEGRDENGAGDLHQHARSRRRGGVDDQRDERVLEEIVVEGRQELAQEQGSETPGRQQVEHRVAS